MHSLILEHGLFVIFGFPSTRAFYPGTNSCVLVLGILQKEKQRRGIDYAANPTDPTVTRGVEERLRAMSAWRGSLLF